MLSLLLWKPGRKRKSADMCKHSFFLSSLQFKRQNDISGGLFNGIPSLNRRIFTDQLVSSIYMEIGNVFLVPWSPTVVGLFLK